MACCRSKGRMTEVWPHIAGRMRGGIHVLPVRVYFEDTDFGGVVYHANYLKFCERGRSDWLRLLGIHHHRLAGLVFVVRHMTCDFRRAARIDDLLEVETKLLDSTGARVGLAQEVRRGGETLFAATVTVALVDSHGKPRRIPAEFAASFK